MMETTKILKEEQSLDFSWRKLITLVFLLLMVSSFFISGFFYFKLESASKQLSDTNDSLNKSNKTLEILTNELNKKNNKYDSLLKVIYSHQDITNAKNSNIEKIKEYSENIKYTIGLTAYRANPDIYNKIENYFVKNGYSFDPLSFNITAENFRPDWMAKTSSIFYYDASAWLKANELKKDMEKVTHTNFRILRGNGLGVKKGLEKTTIYIHYINN